MIEDNRINVKIGELKVIKDSEKIAWVILGSCVSVIFHVKKDLALICHAMSPSPLKRNTPACSSSCPHPCFVNHEDLNKFKYVSCSLEYMIDYLEKYRINLKQVKTTLIGGASLIIHTGFSKLSPGARNVLMAKQLLEEHGIKINREITGGNDGYTLWFYVKDNRLRYKRHNESKIIEA